MKIFLKFSVAAMISAGIYGLFDMTKDLACGTMIRYDRGEVHKKAAHAFDFFKKTFAVHPKEYSRMDLSVNASSVIPDSVAQKLKVKSDQKTTNAVAGEKTAAGSSEENSASAKKTIAVRKPKKKKPFYELYSRAAPPMEDLLPDTSGTPPATDSVSGK